MKKIVTILSIILASVVIVTSTAVFAEERELNADELAAFITRKEFNEWQEAFIASLSELDLKSTSKIYSDMEFYDLQYQFTSKYTGPEYLDPDTKKPTPKLQQMILEEKAKRGLLS